MPKKTSTELQVSQPLEGNAPDTSLLIEVDPAKAMRVGTYVFQLKVTDDSGNVSEPTEAKLIVFDEGRPLAIIDGPQRVPFGKGFMLSGERSRDEGGGRIVKFTWTLLSAP